MPAAPTRRLGRVLLVVVAGLLLSLLPATAAQAHAQLLDSDPVDGAELDEAPQMATLTFDEHITVVPGAIRLFDSSGQAIELNSHVDGSSVQIELPEEMADGAYAVAWRVISADSHPVSGAVSFTVGAADGGVADVPTDSDAALGAQRLLKAMHYVGLLVLGGLSIFLSVIARPGQLPATPVRRLLRISAGLAVLSIALLVPITAMATLGRPLAAITSASEWTSSITAESVAILALTTVGAAGVLMLCRNGSRLMAPRWLLAVPLFLLLGAPALSGHSMLIAPRPVMVVTDVLHVAVAAVWLGGTIGLSLLLARSRAHGVEAAAQAVRRFSALAAWTVGALTLSGVILALLIVPQWTDVVATSYGRALLIKIGLVAITLGLAWWNRTRLLPRLRAQPAEREWPTLQRIVSYEAAMLVLIVIVTATLVTLDPQNRGHEHVDSPNSSASSEWHTHVDDLELVGEVDGTQLTFDVTSDTGEPAEPIEPPVVRASMPEADLGPLELETQQVGAGQYEADLDVPVSGEWRLDIPLRMNTYEEPVASITLELSQDRSPRQ